MYQGIIFDFNGTMFFDSQENEQAWRQFIYTSANREITDQEFQHPVVQPVRLLALSSGQVADYEAVNHRCGLID